MYVSAIEELIKSRALEVGITYAQIIRRAGYVNESKGLRRLKSLFDSNFDSTRQLIERLPEALDLPKEVIESAIAKSIRDLEALEDREWRTGFKPNLLILTEQNGKPRQITKAAICNARSRVYLEFPDELSTSHYLQYALKILPAQLIEVDCFFYAPIGFVINWSPDQATLYKLDGSYVEDLPHAQRGVFFCFCLK